MFQKEWWDETVRLPFEFTTIPAPAGYDARLTKEYGDYMTIKQVPSTHGGTILDADHAYNEQQADGT
jgi:lipopolysaccharide cholinephosphotransferase